MASAARRPQTPPSGRRLASSPSAYLRSASEQQIDWYPWGDEPFRRARESGRPLLLDIGAAWCHWCHVMDEGTYTDAEVCRLLADGFIAVKVDRDEHPEVDRRFQAQVGALTGQGGWPLTALLTANGEVFLGGTYFPPEDGHGRPGLRRILAEVGRLWVSAPERLLAHLPDLRRALASHPGESGAESLDPEQFRRRLRVQLRQAEDPVHGGFGLAPKFPHPVVAEALIADGRSAEGTGLARRALQMLEGMADGGLYDQVGGGFHRYSVDEAWRIPHFEKIATDNAELLAAYVAGAKEFSRPRLAEVVRGTVHWISTALADPAGGFGSSQDADNAPGDDGSFFTWSRPELQASLGAEEYRFARRLFGIGTDARMPDDPERNVLFRALSVEQAAEGIATNPRAASALLDRTLSGLAEARARRRAPTVDGALYANVNGSLIRGLAIAGQFLDDSTGIALARNAADRFLREVYTPKAGLAHRLGGEGSGQHGLLDDQAQFALGLVELSAATGEARYMAAADSLLELIDREFTVEPPGLLRSVAPGLYDGPDAGRPGAPTFPIEDSPHLSAHAAYALADLRRAALVGDPAAPRARRVVGRAAARLAGGGVFAGGMYLAATMLAVAPARVVVQGTGAAARSLLRAAQTSSYPNLVAFAGDPGAPFSGPEASLGSGGTTARALVCFGTRCLEPITDASRLRELLHAEARETVRR